MTTSRFAALLAAPLLLASFFVSPTARADDFFGSYDSLRRALANDDDAAAARAARAMVDAAPEGEVRAAARAVASARALAARREAFARLSERAIAAGLGRGRVVYRCPMAPGRPRWIQARGGAIGNPYLGRSMPTCGEVAHVHGREASDTVATRPTEALELHVVVARVSRKDERCVS